MREVKEGAWIVRRVPPNGDKRGAVERVRGVRVALKEGQGPKRAMEEVMVVGGVVGEW